MTRRLHAPVLATGFVGATLVLLGGLVTSTMPPGHLLSNLWLRGSMPGRMLGLAVVVLGLGLLALSWVRLWRRAACGSADLGVVRRHVALWCSPLLAAPPLFSRDAWSYAAQGELVARGLSPYDVGPGVLGPLAAAVDPRWLWTPAPYGPLPLLWGGGAAELVDSPWLLVVAHRTLALAGLALLAWALPRLATLTDLDPVVVSAAVLPSPLVLAHGVGGAHNDLLMAGLATAALVLATRSWAAGAVLGGLAAAVKLPGGVVCVAVALLCLPVGASHAHRARRLAQVAAVSVGTLWLTGLVAGVGHGWIGALDVPTSIATPLSLTSVLSTWVPGIQTAGTVAAVGVVLAVAARGRTGDAALSVQYAALMMSVTVVLSPVVHAWYALWCLPLLAAAVRDPRGVVVSAWLSLVLGLAAPLDSSLAGLPVHVTVTTVLVTGTVALLTGALRQSVLPVPVPSWPADLRAAPYAAPPSRAPSRSSRTARPGGGQRDAS